MICNVALVFAAVVASHLCVASPVADPDPYYKHTHIKVIVPEHHHTVHHHHVEKIPILKEVPVIKEVPIIKEVPVIKHVPVLHEVHVPIVKHVAIEKPVFLPYKETEYISSWH